MLIILIRARAAFVLLAILGTSAAWHSARPAATQARSGTSTAAVTARVVAAAEAFLATLTPEERARVTFGFQSSQRTGWSNLPTGIFQRNGLRLGDLTTRQRDAALALVASALSRAGYQK